jgi:hypothetical protein
MGVTLRGPSWTLVPDPEQQQQTSPRKRKRYKSALALGWLDAHYPDGSWKTHDDVKQMLLDMKRDAGIVISPRTFTRLRSGKK